MKKNKYFIFLSIAFFLFLFYSTPVFSWDTGASTAADMSTYDADSDGIIDAGAFDLTGVLGSDYDSEAKLKALMPVTQAASVADGGTLTPTAGYKEIDISLTQTTATTGAVTLSEVGVIANAIVRIYNIGINAATFPFTSAVQEFNGGEAGTSLNVAAGGSVSFQYKTDRWVCIANESSTAFFSTFTTTETDFIPIAWAIDGASAPAALATKTSGTDKLNTRDFAGDGDEDVLIPWKVPLDIDATSGIKFRVVCAVVSATAPSSETWQFEMQGFSLGTGDALDGTLGTAQTSNSGSRSDAQYDVVETAWSAAMTGTHITDLAAGETVLLKLYRDIDDTDTYVQDVGVIGIEIKYKRQHNATF